MSAADFLKKLPSAFDASAAGDTEATIQFNCSTPMYAEIKGGKCAMKDGTAGSPDLALTMQDDDLVALLKGELNGIQAFLSGQLQAEGNMMLAQQVATFFDASKLK